MSSTLLRYHINRLMKASTESMPSKDGREREFCFYGKMVDKSDLDKATSYSDQLQYRILVPSKEKGREIAVRLRKEIQWYQKPCEGSQGDMVPGWFTRDPIYFLTIKSFVKGEEGCAEAEVQLPAEQGDLMLEIFRANGTDGLMKRRFNFPVGCGYFPTPEEHVNQRTCLRMRFPPTMVWEVDVPKENKSADDLTRSEVDDVWAKLDLEVDDFADFKVKNNQFQIPFPIRLYDVVYGQVGKRSKEEEAIVKEVLGYMKPKD
jgi:hypothetical protein